jgi:hypothetical protein
MTPRTRHVLIAAGLLILAGRVGYAELPGDDPAQPRIAQLEERLRMQQERTAALEARLEETRRQDLAAARADALRGQVREVLAEQEFREALCPPTTVAGYDRGFVIRSTDEKFLLRVNGRIQARWTYYQTRRENRYLAPGFRRHDRAGLDLQRIRLTFSGHAYSPDLTYRIDLRMDSPGGYDAGVQTAWVNYRFAEGFQLKAGVFKLASVRAQMIEDGSLQFVDRTVEDAVFQFDRGLGVRLWGALFKKRVDYCLDVVNSFNSFTAATITPDPAEMDNNPGIVFHTLWHVLSEQPGQDFAWQADHELHQYPALDLGFQYAFNDDDGDQRATRIPFPRPDPHGPGGFGMTSTNGLQIHQFGWDAMFKYRGFSTSGEYVLRLVDPRGESPAAPWTQLTGQRDTTAQHGAYVQCGYMLPIPGVERKLEIVGRVGGLSAVANGREGTWEYAGGVNWYFRGDDVKLQADVTKVSEVPITSSPHSLANVNDDALIFRVQLQVAF